MANGKIEGSRRQKKRPTRKYKRLLIYIITLGFVDFGLQICYGLAGFNGNLIQVNIITSKVQNSRIIPGRAQAPSI